jgi:hypothetical protein
MKNIREYTDYLFMVSEDLHDKVIPYHTRQYIEKKIDVLMYMKWPDFSWSKELQGLILKNWRPLGPINSIPIRLIHDRIGTIECILMAGGEDVIKVRFIPMAGGPPEYFIMDGGFVDRLTFDPKRDAMELSVVCARYTYTVIQNLLRRLKVKNLFGV